MDKLIYIFSKKNKKYFFIIFLSCQVYFYQAANFKEDSLKAKYDITDPRNPHCACHQYQKLADEEYKKRLGVEIKINNDKFNDDDKKIKSGATELNSNNETTKTKYHSRKTKWHFFEFKKKKCGKKRKAKRLRRDNTACFHF